MLINDFSIETVELGGYPVQVFAKRFGNCWEMFLKSAALFEDTVHAIEEGNRVTFGQTAEMATALAAQIKEKTGAGKGDHIGILMENSIRFVVSFWAVQSMGATAVIFNTRLAAPELKRQLLFSDLRVLLYTPLMSANMRDIPQADLDFQQIVMEDDWRGDLPEGTYAQPLDGISEDDTAFILFTSGTSGTPKGVMLTHRNIITCAIRSGATIAQGLSALVEQSVPRVPPARESTKAQHLLIVAPLFHIMALEQMMAAVFLGLGSVLIPAFDPRKVAEMIKRGEIYGMVGTPTMYWLLINKTNIRELKADSIRSLGFGAAPMAPDLLKELRRVFPSARLRNGYGMTEVPSISSLQSIHMETHPTSVGKSTFCTEVRIIDPVSREDLGTNIVGELAARGACVSRGYYKLPEETAQVFQKGWFFSGDMAYIDADGFIYLVGRSREMINRGGENVYPVEVENVLHLHPKVLDVAVFGLPDPVMGSLVACAVVPRPGAERITLEEIREFCMDKLASYKIPKEVFFLTELPTNPGGKVMKNKLVEQFTRA
jgi:long-chain acyl-CoA synthetase